MPYLIRAACLTDQRGPGNWQLLHQQAARCRRLRVPITFIAVMMQSNFDQLAQPQ
jgi:hypothetical protein